MNATGFLRAFAPGRYFLQGVCGPVRRRVAGSASSFAKRRRALRGAGSSGMGRWCFGVWHAGVAIIATTPEDAFQATFLVLVRKGRRGVRRAKRSWSANWLLRPSRATARQLRGSAVRDREAGGRSEKRKSWPPAGPQGQRPAEKTGNGATCRLLRPRELRPLAGQVSCPGRCLLRFWRAKKAALWAAHGQTRLAGRHSLLAAGPPPRPSGWPGGSSVAGCPRLSNRGIGGGCLPKVRAVGRSVGRAW